MNIIIGIGLVLIGVAFILKSEWFLQNFGSIGWAEEHLGTSGGTRLMYKLLGIILIFVGMLMVTGLMEGFLMGTVGRLFIRQ